MGCADRLNLPAHVRQHVFDDAQGMAAALADRVAAMLRHVLGQGREASLVVSGGRSPVPFLQALAQRKLDWSRVVVTLADERWVPPEHPDSNARLVRASLLQGPAAAARFVPLYGGEANPGAGLAACTERLGAVQQPFDVVVLGMGEDGHFASLFPGVAGLERLLGADAPALAAIDPPTAAHPRISLSLAALAGARNLLVQISGARKRSVLEEAAACGDPGLLPIAALLAHPAVAMQVFFSPSE